MPFAETPDLAAFQVFDRVDASAVARIDFEPARPVRQHRDRELGRAFGEDREIGTAGEADIGGSRQHRLMHFEGAAEIDRLDVTPCLAKVPAATPTFTAVKP